MSYPIYFPLRDDIRYLDSVYTTVPDDHIVSSIDSSIVSIVERQFIDYFNYRVWYDYEILRQTAQAIMTISNVFNQYDYVICPGDSPSIIIEVIQLLKLNTCIFIRFPLSLHSGHIYFTSESVLSNDLIPYLTYILFDVYKVNPLGNYAYFDYDDTGRTRKFVTHSITKIIDLSKGFNIIPWPNLPNIITNMFIYSEDNGIRCIKKYTPGQPYHEKYYVDNLRNANVLILMIAYYCSGLLTQHYIPQIPILNPGIYCIRYRVPETKEYEVNGIIISEYKSVKKYITGTFKIRDTSNSPLITMFDIDAVLFKISDFYDIRTSRNIRKLKRKDGQLQFGLQIYDLWLDASKLINISEKIITGTNRVATKDFTDEGFRIYRYVDSNGENKYATVLIYTMFDLESAQHALIDADTLIITEDMPFVII